MNKPGEDNQGKDKQGKADRLIADVADHLTADMADRLLKEAVSAADHAYAPYSGFSVGAAVLAADGRIFTGCNVENASYGLGICAERVAVFNAVSQGVRDLEAVALSVPPCGACLQVLAEFNPRLAVILPGPGPGGDPEILTLEQLLPRPFSPSHLIDRSPGLVSGRAPRDDSEGGRV